MSIKGDIQELEIIRQELKALTVKRKSLKAREKALENKIVEYLQAKDTPGLKHNGTAILLEEKSVAAPKKAKAKDEDVIAVLEKYGIRESDKVLSEIMAARKGEPVLKQKLKLTKYQS
jgi:hypothetical protein